MIESKPIAWQIIKGDKVPVDVDYKMGGEREIGFSVGPHDSKFPLVIDPLLIWHTYVGGTGFDDLNDLAVDLNGNVYVTGRSTVSWGAPVSAFQGDSDAFVAKYNSNGILQWNTFCGSDKFDSAYGIAVDTNGNTYISGSSSKTWGAPLAAYTGGDDAFIVKLNPNGTRLWHTFLGGAGDEIGHGIALDTTGNIYLAGEGNAAWGAPVNGYSGGDYDALSAKFNAIGVLQWYTFLGSDDRDWIYSTAVDSTGNVYVAGFSKASWGAPIVAHSGGFEAFAAKLNSNGVRQWNTFFGQAGTDCAYDIILDANADAYISGYSNGTFGAPISPYAGSNDAFVVKLNSNGTRLWNTFLGGAGNEEGYSIAHNNDGLIYVAGHTAGSWGMRINLIIPGVLHAFAAELTTNGTRNWEFSMGSGTGTWRARGIGVDPNKNIYIGGEGNNWGTPITPHSGNSEGFIAKLNVLPPTVTTTPASNVNASTATSGGNVTSDGGAPVTERGVCWSSLPNPTTANTKTSDGAGTGSFTSSLTGLTPNTLYYARAYATNSAGTSYGSPITFTTEAGTYDLTVTSMPGGSTNPPAGIHAYRKDSTATVTATPLVGKSFDYWGGDVAGADKYNNPLSIFMDSDKSIIAYFTNSLLLTLTSTAGGTTSPPPGVYSHTQADRVLVKAEPGANARFAGWSGDVPDGQQTVNPIRVIMDRNKSVKANFVIQRTLNVQTGANGTVVEAPGTYVYDHGTLVSLKAIPQQGYGFAGWTGDVPAGKEKNNPLSLTMDKDRTVKANFRLMRTLKVAATAGGITTPAPGTYQYLDGTQVTLTGIPDAHYECVGWTGDTTGGGTTLTVTMDQDISVTAHFQRKIYKVLDLTGERVINRSLTQIQIVDVLRWKANPDNEGITGYRIYCSIDGIRKLINQVGASTLLYLNRDIDDTKSHVYEVVAVNKLDEKFNASPAIVGDQLFLKGERNLYCTTEPTKEK